MDNYGFSNTETINGKQVFLPRFGLNYQHNKTLSFKGGLGMYSGGTPSVWVSNTYTNDGVSVSDSSSKDAADIDGFDGRNIPEKLQALESGQGNVDALDPDFKIPQTMKFSLGSNYRFDVPMLGKNFLFSTDYTYSKVKHGVLWKDLRRNKDTYENNTPVAKGQRS